MFSRYSIALFRSVFINAEQSEERIRPSEVR